MANKATKKTVATAKPKVTVTLAEKPTQKPHMLKSVAQDDSPNVTEAEKAELQQKAAAARKQQNSKFQKGTGVYECKVCGKKTRYTGGDGYGVGLCEPCWDKAGDENAVLDGQMTQAEFDAQYPDTVKPAKKTHTPPKTKIHTSLTLAGFVYNRTPEPVNGFFLHGYTHKDGRVAVYSISTKGASESWAVGHGNGAQDKGKDITELRALLKATAKAKAVPAPKPDKASPKVVTAPATAPATAPTASQGLPPQVVRAVEILGGLTLQRYDLDTLAGKNKQEQRRKLAARLLKQDSVSLEDSALTKLTALFYQVLGVSGDTVDQRKKDFITKAKAISLAARKEKVATKKADAEYVAKAKAASKIFVPGTILPATVKETKKQRQALDSAKAAEVFALAATAEPIHAPRPEAEVTLVATDVRLLEDPSNGIVMLQLEKSNSQGAICVYNNGVRVAVGVVPTEKLKKLRQVSGEVDLIQAANQLLNPIVPSVPVTPVAQRHLTAVIHCKELKVMANEKKFASPKSVATKSTAKAAKAEEPEMTKAEIKAAAKAAAAKAEAKAAKAETNGRASRVSDDAKIKILNKANPYREGSKSHTTFELLLKSKTVGDFRTALENSKNETYEATHFLNYASKQRGNIEPMVAVS